MQPPGSHPPRMVPLVSGCLSVLTCLAGAWSRLLPSLLLGRARVLVAVLLGARACSKEAPSEAEKAACFKRGHCARAGLKCALVQVQPEARGGRDDPAACSPFHHCARAQNRKRACFGSNRGAGRNTAAYPHFPSCARAGLRTENALWFQPGVGGKKHNKNEAWHAYNEAWHGSRLFVKERLNFL